jgi:hypothetical protein
MTTEPGSHPDPHHAPAPDPAEALPAEEGIDEAKVQEQLETEPDEAENATDGFAPDTADLESSRDRGEDA